MNPDKDEPDLNAWTSSVRFSDCLHFCPPLGRPKKVSRIARRLCLLVNPWWFTLFFTLFIGHESPDLVFAQTIEWKSMGLQNVPIIDLVVDERKPAVQGTDASSTTICAITPTNVYISHGDSSWYVLNNLSLDQDIACFSYPTNSGYGLLCSTEYGIMQSYPLGSEWEFIGSGFGAERSVVSMSVARSSPSFMYAITSENSSNGADDEIIKTNDRGKTWFALSTPPQQTSPTLLHGVYVDPHRSNTVYATVDEAGVPWVIKSTDGGARWNEIKHFHGVAQITDLCFDPEISNTVYFIGGTVHRGGIYKSTDGLRTYEQKMESKRLFRLFMHPTNRQILFGLELPHTIHYSTNAGERWSTVNTVGLNSKYVALSMAVDSHSTIYLGIAKHGVFRSEQKIGNHISSLKALGSIISVSTARRGE